MQGRYSPSSRGEYVVLLLAHVVCVLCSYLKLDLSTKWQRLAAISPGKDYSGWYKQEVSTALLAHNYITNSGTFIKFVHTIVHDGK